MTKTGRRLYDNQRTQSNRTNTLSVIFITTRMTKRYLFFYLILLINFFMNMSTTVNDHCERNTVVRVIRGYARFTALQILVRLISKENSFNLLMKYFILSIIRHILLGQYIFVCLAYTSSPLPVNIKNKNRFENFWRRITRCSQNIAAHLML